MANSTSANAHSELESSLIVAIQKFFDDNLSTSDTSQAEEKGQSEKNRTRINDRQLQLATAVLLLEVARSDFDTCADEFQTIAKGVRKVLGLTEDEAVVAVRFAEEEVKQSKRLHRFTTLIDENYSLEQKKSVIRNLWQVAFSDAVLHASEEYLIRKISDLLHLPRADFLAAKIEARDAFR